MRISPFTIVALVILLLGSLACFNQTRPNAIPGSCQRVATTTDPDELQALYEKGGERSLVLVEDVVYLCDCAPSRRIGGDTENRRLAGDTENRDLEGDQEERRLAGDTEGRDLKGDTEGRDLRGDTEGRDLKGDTEARDLKGDTEGRDLDGDTEARRLAGDTEDRDLDGDTEDRGLGGDTETRRLAGGTEDAACLANPQCGSWSISTVKPTHTYDERGLLATSLTCFP